MSRRWFILKVGVNREEKVRRSLMARVQSNQMQDLVPEVLVVMERVIEIKAGQRRSVQRRVYPGYVMTEIDVEEDGSIPPAVWHAIRELPGRVAFVGSSDKPQPMSPDEVSTMMRRLETLSRPEVPVVVDLKRGDRVQVKEGSFAGVDGIVEDVVAEKGLVRVMVPFCGRVTPIDFELWKVEKRDD